jgi:hypothetical protein
MIKKEVDLGVMEEIFKKQGVEVFIEGRDF